MAVRRGLWASYHLTLHDVMRAQLIARAREQGYTNIAEWIRLVIRQELNNRRLPNAAYHPPRITPKRHSQAASMSGTKATSDTCPTATGTANSPPGNTDQSKLE